MSVANMNESPKSNNNSTYKEALPIWRASLYRADFFIQINDKFGNFK
jgi:hypothetical protein